jgi:uncharacterized C2H2 Zn-finger protein
MVKRIQKDKEIYFRCEECGYLYKEKHWAFKCERWCSENNSCNLKITKHAIKNEKES